MNTNSKHYEELKIQPWDIMEQNFTNEEFVAYLKGNIIKYTLRDKGQALTDAQKIKHYAEKLIEVLETIENDIELLKEEEPKKTLEPNKWYNAKDFTVEELKELLPVGTVVIVTEKPDGNRIVDLPYERLLSTTVSNIGRNELKNSTRVGISADIWWRRYFKIEEE